MLKAIRVSAMLLVLVGSAHAGEVLTPPAPTTPPQPARTAQEPTLNGIMSTPDVSESMTEIALELLAVLPSLL